MAIDSFTGEHAFLSNFYVAPTLIDGLVYPTNEHYFQAHKSTNPTEWEAMLLMSTPGQAKRLGRQLTLRPDWDQVKLHVMYRGLRGKFLKHPELREALLATGDQQLIEGNHWGDRYWGVSGGTGQNHLGRLLMLVRHCLSNSIISVSHAVIDGTQSI